MTTHALPPDPAAAGPTIGLVALPDPSEVRLTVPQEVYAHLTRIEAARQRQLDALPSTDLGVVPAAHRATIERILDEVRSARRRVTDGLYGVCAGCNGEVSLQRLELRPWTTSCARCDQRDHDRHDQDDPAARLAAPAAGTGPG